MVAADTIEVSSNHMFNAETQHNIHANDGAEKSTKSVKLAMVQFPGFARGEDEQKSKRGELGNWEEGEKQLK